MTVIRIRLDDDVLGRTRLAISPLQEVVAGVELVHRGHAPWPYAGWAAHARTVLETVPETGPLRLFKRLYGVDHGRPSPDVFQPVPPGPRPTLDDELAVLRTTPHDVLAAQCAKHYPEGVPDFLRPYLDSPDRAFKELADAFTAFWELAVAPHWPAMRAVLEEEIMLRARTLAAYGPDAVLTDVRGPALWESSVLSLPKKRETALDTTGQGLLLVPVVLAEGKPGVSTDHPSIIMVTYQARGAAVLASSPPAADRTDRLGQLVGPARAAMLRALRTPATTSGLAAVLGRAPSTVSEQLTALVAAGVASRSRSERQVFYGLEPAGTALLAMFDPPGAGEALEAATAEASIAGAAVAALEDSGTAESLEDSAGSS